MLWTIVFQQDWACMHMQQLAGAIGALPDGIILPFIIIFTLRLSSDHHHSGRQERWLAGPFAQGENTDPAYPCIQQCLLAELALGRAVR